MRNQDWDPETFLTPEEDHVINVILYWVLLIALLGLVGAAIGNIQLDKRNKEIEKQRQIQKCKR